MLAIKPSATITEQNFPKPPRPSYPATIRAPVPVPAAAQAGSLESPDAKPVPSAKQKVKDRESPMRVAVKTCHRGVIFGSQ